MLPNPKNYAIYPSVVPAGEPAEMTIAPNERAFMLFDDISYTLRIVAVNGDECSFYYAPTPQALLPLFLSCRALKQLIFPVLLL